MLEQTPNPGKSQQELEAENEWLKNELKNRNAEIKKWHKFQFWAGKKIGGIFLGWQLKDSIHRLFGELTQGKVTQQTLADVVTHTLWRFTRIGIFAILAAIIPVTFLALQTWLLSIQNKRIIQQTYLQEAERRSSQVFLFSNIQDKIDEELKDPHNKKDTLSNQTIGRIIALSLALKPYRYLDGDTLINNPISPERGQLLISLTNLGLDTTTLLKIARKGNFSQAELINVKLSSANLKSIDLRGANLTYANLMGANFEGADLRGADLREVDLRKADLRGTDLSGANLRGANLIQANLRDAYLQGTNLRDAYLQGINLRDADLRNADLRGVDLQNADLRDTYLEYAKLKDAHLKKTNFEGAVVAWAVSLYIEEPKVHNKIKKRISSHPYIEEHYKVSREEKDGETIYVLRKK